MKIAFIGFRHGHAMGLYNYAVKNPEVTIAGVCEEDAETAASLRDAGKVKLTHTSYQKMLDSVDCNVVGVGEYFAKRGPVIIEALKRGKHVISDKPICIRESELAEIKKLAAEKKLSVGCLLDMRSYGALRTVKRLIGEGAIGEVHTITFTGQHPLLLGLRPAWYFQPGLQGGTINDIAVHAMDAVPWMTGRKFVEVTAARAWNARLPQHPQFQDAAQFMLKMDNGGGVLADVSYLAPDGCGYAMPQYWRMTFHGSGGVIECNADDKQVYLARSTDKGPHAIEPDAAVPHAAIEAFRKEIAGAKDAAPSTADVLEASRLALLVQRAADENKCGLKL